MRKRQLPFKAGQEAESQSFETGFRGAWFRCKIKKMYKGHKSCTLEYFDFPDEKLEWTKLYQNRDESSVQDKKMHLMVRPKFPLVCLESQLPIIHTITEVIAVVDGVWKVGDLVDWFKDDCFWSGRITEVVGEDKFKIELPLPPLGEGGEYEALCKDIRPSLEWTPERGWTVPISVEGETCRSCARLIQPVDQENRTVNDPAEEGVSFDISTDSCTESMSSLGSAGSLPVGRSANAEDVSAAAANTEERISRYNSSGSSKKMRVSGTEYSNSSFSDTIESSILDLEELATRIKWLRRVHEFGLESASAMIPSWKFLEDRVSIKHK